MRGNNFQLLVSAVAGLLVIPPTPKLRCVPEPVALHVIIGDFHDELGT